MVTNNEEIKRILKYHNIPYWKLGEKIGVSEITLCRWLRKPVTEDVAKRIEEAITELTKE